MKCPVCQSDAFKEEEVEGELICADCLAVCDADTGVLLEIDGLREVA